MSNTTSKPTADLSHENVLRSAYNKEDSSITTSGFLVGKVGHKVTQATSTTTIANDTLTYNFLDGAALLYSIKVIYTDATYATMISAERTA